MLGGAVLNNLHEPRCLVRYRPLIRPESPDRIRHFNEIGPAPKTGLSDFTGPDNTWPGQTLVLDAIVPKRVVARRASTIFRKYVFGIGGIGHAVVSVGMPTRRATTKLRNGRLGVQVWHAHIANRMVPRGAATVFGNRHYLHGHRLLLLWQRGWRRCLRHSNPRLVMFCLF